MVNSDRSRCIIFALDYITHWNGARAARKAGFSEHSSNVTAARLLSDPDVQELICDAMLGRLERVKVDADYVLKELHSLWESDVGDILDNDGYVLPLREWPTAWKRQLNGFENLEMFDGTGAERAKVADLKKVKWIDRAKVIDMIGKHCDVGSWVDKKELTGKDGTPLIPENVRITRRITGAPTDD